MRNLISGIVGLAWGGLILLGTLLHGLQGEGAAYAGQVCGLVMGFLFFFGGAFYLFLGLRELQPEGPRRKRRRRDADRPRRRRRSRWDEDD